MSRPLTKAARAALPAELVKHGLCAFCETLMDEDCERWCPRAIALALLADLDAKDAALEPFIPADIALAAFEDGRLVIMKLSDDTSSFALASFPFRVLRRAAEALGGE